MGWVRAASGADRGRCAAPGSPGPACADLRPDRIGRCRDG